MGDANGQRSTRMDHWKRITPKPWQRASDRQNRHRWRPIDRDGLTATQRMKRATLAARARKRDAKASDA